MGISDGMMRRYLHFYNNKNAAMRDAKARKGVVIQEIRGRQWATCTGSASIKEALKRGSEAMAYLGKPKPKIIADFRK